MISKEVEYFPGDFLEHPWKSLTRSHECEIVAVNIMRILKHTGNVFRELPIKEYVCERKKEGNWSNTEIEYFNHVINYCISYKKASLFSKTWKAIILEGEHTYG